MADKGKAISSAIDRFMSTYFAVSEKNARDEERADDRKYREFYMKLQEDAAGRSAESHAQAMESGKLQLEAVEREAAASLAILEQEGKTLEQLVAEGKVAELGEYAASMRELAMEQAKLQTQTSRFMLDEYYPAQLGQIRASTARTKALAAGGGRGGGKPDDPLKKAQGELSMMEQRRKIIQSQIESRAVKDVYGNPDYSGEDLKPLLEKRDLLDAQMLQLSSAIGDMQAGGLGLITSEDWAASGAVGGPGSSEAQADPMESFLSEQGKPAPLSAEAQRQRELERARQTNLGTRKAVYVDPASGTLTATDDATLLRKAAERAKAEGKELEVFRQGEVPTDMIGLTVEDWKRKERNRAGFALGPGGAGMMR